jgi:hypothetical protein
MPNTTSGMNLITVLVLVFTMANFSFSQTYWKRMFDIHGLDNFSSIVYLPEGDLIAVGTTYHFDNGKDVYESYLVKTKTNGDTIWTKIFNDTSNREMATAVIPLQDGNILVAEPYSYSYPPPLSYLRKISFNGNTIWKKSYNLSSDIIIPTPDGNLLIGGYYDQHSYCFLKVNYNGDIIWTPKKYIGSFSAITATSDGNYIAAGYRDSIINPNSSSYTYFYLMKFNPDGDTIWTKIYLHTSRYSYNEVARSIAPTQDGNFIVTGVSIMKINLNGDTLWTKSHESLSAFGANSVQVIATTRDGNFMVVGGPILYKMKLNSDTIWKKKYPVLNLGYNGFDSKAIASTPGGDFVIATVCSNYSPSGVGGSLGWLFYIVDDKYAYKNSSFTYKIPSAEDSLNYTYTPLVVPSGMAISNGGTISWTPTTDSVYTEHIAVFVTDGQSKKDTLSFNINVNSLAVPINNHPQITYSGNPAKSTGISITSYSSRVMFTIPIKTSTLEIYDIKGHLAAKLPVENNTAVWRGTNAAGRYVVRVSDGKQRIVRPFVVVR